MYAYSSDLRERVIRDRLAGLGTRAAAAKYSVSEAWVRRLMQRRRETGEVTPRPCRNRRVSKLAPLRGRILEIVADAPDLTLAEIRDRLGVAVALSALWAAVKAADLTVKKKSPSRRSATAPT